MSPLSADGGAEDAVLDVDEGKDATDLRPARPMRARLDYLVKPKLTDARTFRRDVTHPTSTRSLPPQRDRNTDSS